MNITKNDVKCPFCGEHYANDYKNVSEALIYRKAEDDSHSVICAKNYRFYYRTANYGGRLIKQNIPQSSMAHNMISKCPESFFLFMCKCPNCQKVYSIIIKKGSQYKNKSIVNVCPTTTRSNNYHKYNVPSNICEDYEEACKILYLSPKSSATLSRRTLEDILTQYFNIKNSYINKNGKKRFRSLKKKLDILKKTNVLNKNTIKALNSLRKIGNAGAHLDVQSDRIISVKPHEAGNLIKMIEILLSETYVKDYKYSKIEDDTNNDAKRFK